jgi:hypothetical protein
MTIQNGNSIHGFTLSHTEDIPELRSQARLFTHTTTKTGVLHLYNEDPNNLFAIALRTPVQDNTGVPHILEHAVLSGSRKFALKDPFQYMLRSSLHTFLNALTYPDKTVYPASSQVEKDFFNLLDVYCDAVFHPLLTKETFLQEGWHFCVPDMDKPVDISGIVYNEMKGVFSEFSNHVMRRTMSSLFPDTTYRYESGGEPLHITELTYEGLKAFHASYYHPSNACIVLYGDIPTEKTLQFLHERYLQHFDYKPIASAIAPQPRWKAPQRLSFDAPGTPDDDGYATVVVNWLFGEATDPRNRLEGSVLARYLLDTEGSPLRRALLDSGLGEDLSELAGFESELVHNTFAAGLRKAKPENADAIVEIIFTVLRQQAEGNIDRKLLEGALRQQEFRLREIEDSGFLPYNLMLAERCFASWIYDGDPLLHLRFAQTLDSLKHRFLQQPGYVEQCIRRCFLDNPHYLVSVVTASSQKGKKLSQETGRHVAQLTKDISPQEKRTLHEQTKRLLAYQSTPPTPEEIAMLPALSMDDLPRQEQHIPLERTSVESAPVYMHPAFTSGIVYCDWGFDISACSVEELKLLPLLAELMTRCGTGEYSAREMATHIARDTGGLSNSFHTFSRVQDDSRAMLLCMFHTRALEHKVERAGELLAQVCTRPRLDDPDLVRDCLYEMRNDMRTSIIGHGHSYAMRHAAAKLFTAGYAHELTDGIAHLRYLNELIAENDIAGLIDRLTALHARVFTRQNTLFSVTAASPAAAQPVLSSLYRALPQTAADTTHSSLFAQQAPGGDHGIEITSSVNFVARVHRCQDLCAAHMGRLIVLSRMLSTGPLWQSIRMEGGAYGGFARYSVAHPVFSFGSYRDPHVVRTLQAFDTALAQLDKGIDHDTLQQNIIGTIGKIDAPHTPHSRGLRETLRALRGFTPQLRQQVRDSILDTTPETLQETVRMVRDASQRAVTVLGSKYALDEAQGQGISLQRETI